MRNQSAMDFDGDNSYARRVVRKSNLRLANFSEAKLEWIRNGLEWSEKVKFLMEIGFIPDGRNCKSCGVKMSLISHRQNAHGCLWRCNNKISTRCQKKKY